jgi:anti-anti-sigma factor
MGVARPEGRARRGERVERPSGAAPSLGIALRTAGGVSVIELVGELDLGTIPKLETRLLKVLGSHEAVILDLRRLYFIDSLGIGLLIKAHTAGPDSGALHTVISPGSQVDRVLTIAGIHRALPLYFDRDEAVAAIAPRPALKARRARAA